MIRKFNDFSTLKLINQPDDITCGPTCLMILANYFNINTSIETLTNICGTDYETGTTDLKMIKGLDYLNLNYTQFPKSNKSESFNILNEALRKGHIPLLRTLIQDPDSDEQIKHWVLCNPNLKLYSIIDPWLGNYKLNEERLNNIWEPRNYDGFIIN